MPETEDYDDDLFDYDAEIPDIDTTIRAPAPPTENKKDDTLGIDEEVKIRKKRIVVKLDEARLMSELGIPKLRREAPKKLKFKGKGHEYRDTARLLSYYQFWADDLYKKAKFRDTLKIIEKLGHSRSMRDQRLSWIEESKRKEKQLREGSPGDKGSGIDLPKANKELFGETLGDNQDDSDLYSLPQNRAAQTGDQNNATVEGHASSSGALFLPRRADEFSDDDDDDDFGMEPNDDEMDALMAAEGAMISAGASTNTAAASKNNAAVTTELLVDDFEDEMEAMAGLGPDW